MAATRSKGDPPRKDGLIVKTEATLEGFVESILDYLRTFGVLANPLLWGRALRILSGPRKRVGRVPPLLFLSIGSILFAIVIDSAADFIQFDEDPLRHISDKISPKVSPLEMLFVALPVLAFIVVASRLICYLLVNKKERQRFFNSLCYVFGFLGVGAFSVFLAISGLISAQNSYPAPWMGGERFNSAVGVLFLALLLYLLLRSIVLLSIGLWRLNKTEGPRRKILKGAVNILLFSLLIFGSAAIKRLFQSTSSVPQFDFVKEKADQPFTLECDENRNQKLHFKIAVANTTSEPILIRDNFVSVQTVPQIDGMEVLCSAEESPGKIAAWVIKPGDVRIFQCAKVVNKQQYDLLSQGPSFSGSAAWEEVLNPSIENWPSRPIGGTKLYRMPAPAPKVP